MSATHGGFRGVLLPPGKHGRTCSMPDAHAVFMDPVFHLRELRLPVETSLALASANPTLLTYWGLVGKKGIYFVRVI